MLQGENVMNNIDKTLEAEAAEAIRKGMALGARGCHCGPVSPAHAHHQLVHFVMSYKENDFEIYVIKRAK